MRRLETVWVVLLLLAAGCAGRGTPPNPDAATPPPPVTQLPVTNPASIRTLTWEALRSAAYPLAEANGNLIPFVEGKYKGPVVAGSQDQFLYVLLDRIGRGDLDGDGVEDAALLMVKDPTGDIPEYTLWAVINQGGVPNPRGYFDLGGKIQVGALTIEDLKIYIDVVRPQDASKAGVPVRRIKESYKLLGDRLERADTFR
jgi:hypothetical protein